MGLVFQEFRPANSGAPWLFTTPGGAQIVNAATVITGFNLYLSDGEMAGAGAFELQCVGATTNLCGFNGASAYVDYGSTIETEVDSNALDSSVNVAVLAVTPEAAGSNNAALLQAVTCGGANGSPLPASMDAFDLVPLLGGFFVQFADDYYAISELQASAGVSSDGTAFAGSSSLVEDDTSVSGSVTNTILAIPSTGGVAGLKVFGPITLTGGQLDGSTPIPVDSTNTNTSTITDFVVAVQSIDFKNSQGDQPVYQIQYGSTNAPPDGGYGTNPSFTAAANMTGFTYEGSPPQKVSIDADSITITVYVIAAVDS